MTNHNDLFMWKIQRFDSSEMEWLVNSGFDIGYMSWSAKCCMINVANLTVYWMEEHRTYSHMYNKEIFTIAQLNDEMIKRRGKILAYKMSI